MVFGGGRLKGRIGEARRGEARRECSIAWGAP